MQTLLWIVLAFILLQSCNAQITSAYNFLQLNTDVSRFRQAIDLFPALRAVLEGPSPITVFVPLDSAFNYTAGLPSDPNDLSRLLALHILSGPVPASMLTNDAVFNNTLAPGAYLRSNVYNGVNYLNGKRLPNAPFSYRIQSFSVPNGVVHVISEYLIPQEVNDLRTITEEIVNNNNFSILATALDAANLLNVLNTPSPAYTLFAPTNLAFQRIPPGVLTQLISDPEKLTEVLLYHVVASTYFSVGLRNLNSLPTLSGDRVTITNVNNQLRVNDIPIVIPDLHRRNGVIHAIDKILLPPDLCLTPRNDAAKSIGTPSYWCTQLNLASKQSSLARITTTDVSIFLSFINQQSTAFRTLTATNAKRILCGQSGTTYDAELLALWFNIAAGQVFLGTEVEDLCDPNKYSTWSRSKYYNSKYSSKSYNKYCQYTPTPTIPSSIVTVTDALNAAENARQSSSSSTRSKYQTIVSTINRLQSPGSGSCPNVCGVAVSAWRALGEAGSLFEEGSIMSSNMPMIISVTAVASILVTSLIIAIVLFALRGRISKYFVDRSSEEKQTE